MPRTVYITNAMASTLNSSYELSRRLTARGHEITYVSHVDLTEQVISKGHHFVQLNRVRELSHEQQERVASAGNRYSLSGLISRFKIGREYFLKSAEQNEVEQVVADLDPDLLIIDIECHVAILACLNLGIPIVLPIVWHTIFRDRLLPPLHTPFLPPKSFFERCQVGLAWQVLLSKRRITQFLEPFDLRKWRSWFRPIGYTANRRSLLSVVAKAKGVSLKHQTDRDQWMFPHVYRGLDVICFNASEFEFPHQPNPALAYVGPMVFDGQREVVTEQVAQWERFNQECQTAGRKLIYCSLGTYWSTNTTFLRKLIDVLKRHDDWGLVIGLGGKLEAADLGQLPDNVLAMEYAPQIDVLRSADAAITHGGITSINECLHFAVPVLCCSTGFVDQHGCCARVEYHGVGLRMNINEATTDLLEQNIVELLHSEAIATKTAEMSLAFQRYRDQGVAESCIESALSSR